MKTVILLLISSISYGQQVDLNVGSTQTKDYYEEIAYEWIKEKIIIPVEIGGESYRFILDTGAPNIISKEIQKTLQPQVIQTIPVSDINGKKEYLDVVSIKHLSLGKVIFENTASLVYDLKSNPIFGCFKVDGFIGSNMLRNSILQLDSRTNSFIITDNKKNPSLNKDESSKLELVGNQSSPYIWIKLRGKESGREQLLIDTGADGLYDISMENYQVFENEEIFKIISESSGSASIGLFGDVSKESHLQLFLPELEINNSKIKNVVTTTSNDNNSRIGSEILDYGVITIDYDRKKFYFSPFEQEINALKPEFGYSKTYNNGKLIVGFVWDKDLKSQIKYGDQILSINGVKINNASLCDLVSGKIELDDSVQLEILSDNGNTKQIELTKQLPNVFQE